MNDRLEKEIEVVENDDSLTTKEKMLEIRELTETYRNMVEEAAQRAYDDELNR